MRYDFLDRMTQSTDAHGTVDAESNTYRYDPGSRLVGMTDAIGVQTAYAYDSLDRRTGRTDDVGGTLQRSMSYAFDSVGNLIRQTDAVGTQTVWTYDAVNRPIRQVDDASGPNNRTSFMTYDAAGNLASFENARGDTVGYGYDDLDRQTSQTFGLGTADALGYLTRYDRAGRVTAQIDPQSVRREFQYDNRGFLVADIQDVGGVDQSITRYGYGALGRNSSVISPYGPTGESTTIRNVDPIGRVTTMTHDARDQLTSVTNPGGNVLSYSYDSLMRMDSFDDGGGRGLDYTYDHADNLISVDTPLHGFAYEFDALGRMTLDTVGGATNVTAIEEFTDDHLDRIDTQTTIDLTAPGLPPIVQDYTYDAEGRRLSRTEIGGGERVDYQYDAAGKRIGSEGFDAAGQADWRTGTTYDAVGRRMEHRVSDLAGTAVVSDSVDRFSYEGWDLTTIRDSGGAARRQHVHGPAVDAVLADYAVDGVGQGTGQRTDTLHTFGDHQGTIRDFAAVSNGTATPAGHRDYDAFGTLRGTDTVAGTSTAIESMAADHLFGYTGREHTNLSSGIGALADRYDYRMRTYDSSSTRFLQPDPLGLRAGDTNLYRYVSNNAVGYIDPLGLEEIDAGVAAGAYRDTAAPAPTRRPAPGQPECGCTCSCVGVQLEQAASQSRGVPQATDNSAAGKPAPPEPHISKSTTGPLPGALTLGGNASGYTGGRPTGSTEPSGMTAFSLTPFSQDPIGFEAGDGNLYRYVRNQPTNMTDPSGLEAKVGIYINTTGLPPNFNQAGVQAQINQILVAAGCSASMTLILSDRTISYTERGWEQDWTPHTQNEPRALVPFYLVYSHIHDCMRLVGDALTDNERFYIHAVEFRSPQNSSWIAQTGGTHTEVNTTGLRQAAAGHGKVDWDTLYANVLLHEVIYLGLLGNFDDPRAAAKTFGSASANVRVPMALTPDERNSIDEALHYD